MKVYFIVHGNVKIGMGHIIRSISLAQAFKRHGHTVAFFSKYEQGTSYIQEAGMEVYKIPSETYSKGQGFFYGNPEELKEDIIAIRKQIIKTPDVIIVDSYNVSRNFFENLRELTNCLVYIDDINFFPYPIDILVNGTVSAFDMGYEKEQSAQLLLGTKYNQVRKEFSDLPSRRIKENITDILVTTGNGDPFHMTEKVLQILISVKQFSEIKYHVIIGRGFERNIWSKPNIVKNKQILLYDNPSNMREIMLKCDMAVSAGGSTLYELAACGVPTVTFAYANNQLLHIKALEREGTLKYIGYYNKLDENRLVEYIWCLMRNLDMRRRMVVKQQALVDGNGCSRIVAAIEGFLEEKRNKDNELN
jgi:pseudaminic acid biosynthesis-associated protein PseG